MSPGCCHRLKACLFHVLPAYITSIRPILIRVKWLNPLTLIILRLEEPGFRIEQIPIESRDVYKRQYQYIPV